MPTLTAVDSTRKFFVLAVCFRPLFFFQVYTSQELKHSMKWGQAARDRSRARGERFDGDGSSDGSGDEGGGDGRRRKHGGNGGAGGSAGTLATALRGAAAWKPFKCPSQGCLKRYVQRR
jgi:hypothetical protein